MYPNETRERQKLLRQWTNNVPRGIYASRVEALVKECGITTMVYRNYIAGRTRIPDKVMHAAERIFGHGISGTWPQGNPNTEYAACFTGKSYLAPMGDKAGGLVNVTFEPRCRNHRHIHKKGVQVLICVSGRGWYVEDGKAPVEMTEGSVVVIPEGVRHWHGAARDAWFQHLTYMTHTEHGVETVWEDAVGDTEYDLLP